jgi:hypothetical protein
MFLQLVRPLALADRLECIVAGVLRAFVRIACNVTPRAAQTPAAYSAANENWKLDHKELRTCCPA